MQHAEVMTPREITAVDGGVVLAVHAQPGARRNEVVGRHGDAIKIRVAARAVEHRANDALVAFVAEAFGVRRAAVTIRSGANSRHKRLLIAGIDVDAASRLLVELLSDE